MSTWVEMIGVNIRKGTIAEVVTLCHQLEEFINPYPEEEYRNRLVNVPHLILVAEYEGRPLGFKVGYEQSPEALYSWMGFLLVIGGGALQMYWLTNKRHGLERGATARSSTKPETGLRI